MVWVNVCKWMRRSCIGNSTPPFHFCLGRKEEVSESLTQAGCPYKRKQDMPLWKRAYRCENCGLVMDRDENSAINIYQRFVVGASATHESLADVRCAWATRKFIRLKEQVTMSIDTPPITPHQCQAPIPSQGMGL